MPSFPTVAPCYDCGRATEGQVLAMRTIPQRELRNDSGRVLAAVAAGETIEVTSNGTAMAVMVPPQLSPVERGRRDGTVRAARRRVRVSSIPRVTASESIADALDELRGDR